jgi:hypothetical protein
MFKKFGAGSYFTLIAAIAGVVGVVAMMISSNIDKAYAYKTVNSLLVMGICGILLCLVAIWSPTRFGNHDILSTAGTLGAIWMFMSVVGTMISDRVLMIAGLFSYNSQNMVGWRVFYATVTGVAAFVLGCILLIVGAFLKNAKAAR